MGALYLILTMCLSGGHLCTDVDAGEADSVIMCMLSAEPQAADWADRHPGYHLKEFRCTDQKPDGGQDALVIIPERIS